MNGEIDFMSAPGDGSTFTFLVPLEICGEVAETSAAPGAKPKRDFAGARVLLAEDNALNRSLIAAMLSKLGFSVDTVTKGALALEAVAAATPAYDLVLMDMQMPVMDGPEAAKAIRAIGSDRASVPILALTADAMPEHRDRYLAAGLDGILTKPIAWDSFAEMAQEMITRRGMPRADREDPGQQAPARMESKALPPQALDYRTIDSLGELLSIGAVIELLDRMTVSARGTVAAIGVARSSHDMAMLRRRAHELRGMASNLGATRLSNIASILQQEDLACDRVDPLVNALIPALDATVEAVVALRAERSEPA